MCGIAGVYVRDRYVGKFPLDSFTKGLLLGIEHRGRHASGVLSATKNGKRLTLDKAPLTASDFIKRDVKKIHPQSKLALLHTRFFTQGPPEQNENNHPVVFGTCFAVHNGHINNDTAIFQDLDKQRTAEVDSQAIAAVMADVDFDNVDAIKAALGKLRGAFAIAVHDPIRHPGKLILAKGDNSPLYVFNHPTALIWASEDRAIAQTWEALIGTVSKKKLPAGKFEPREFGWKQLFAGDMLIIDNDRIEPESFTVNRGFQRGWQDGSFYHGPHNVPKKWTCIPADGNEANRFKNCLHPCTRGCTGGACECWEGNPNHPKRNAATLLTRRTLVSGDTLEEAYASYRQIKDDHDGIEDVTLLQCWACDAYVINTDLIQMDLHDMGMKNVCLDCAEWETEGDPTSPLAEEGRSCGTTDGTPTSAALLTPGNANQGACEVTVVPEGDKEYLRVAAEENVLHIRAIRELSFESGKAVSYLDWLMFRCSLDKLDANQSLAIQRDEMEYEYENAKEIVVQTFFGKVAESDRGNLHCERLNCKTRQLHGWTDPHTRQRAWACKPCVNAEKEWNKRIRNGDSLIREEVK